MRAWRVHALGEPSEVLRLDEVPVPDAAPGELLVRTFAAGLNLADLLLCRGQYQERPPLPFTPGFEAAGVVERAGEGCQTPVGQTVMTFASPPRGALAEFTVVPESRTFPYALGLAATTAAALPVTYHTAWVALHHRAGLKPGETLLVHGGAGGVGTAAIDLGVAAGARVIATAGGAAKVAVCRKLGAAHVVDHRREDFVEVVNDLTSGGGADVILDPVGGDTFTRSTRCVAFEGRIVTIGFASGTIPTIAANHVLIKNYGVIGLHHGLYHERRPQVLAETHRALMELLLDGRIEPYLDDVLPLDHAVKGLVLLDRRGVRGKVVVSVTPDAAAASS